MEQEKLELEVNAILEDDSFDLWNLVIETGMNAKYIETISRSWLKTGVFPSHSTVLGQLYKSMREKLLELAEERITVEKVCPNCDRPLGLETDSRGKDQMVCRKCGYSVQVHPD